MRMRSFLILFATAWLGAGFAMAQEYPPSGAPANWKPPVMDAEPITFFQVDRSEIQLGRGDNTYLWDTQGWYGNDANKLWVKAEGGGAFGSSFEVAEFQGLWSHMITPFFDFQAGVRQDAGPGPSPTYAVLGLQGLAPYWFEVDSALFLSDDGDLTARVELEYELLFTQRLIGQPRLEANFAAQDVPGLGIGSGLSTLEAGFRLRYEIRRQFAPYVGIAWQSAVGNTADFRRLAGDRVAGTRFVAGVRLWF